MAWNRPSNDGRAVSTKPPLRRGHRPRPTALGAVVGAVVVLGAAVAAWWLWPTADSVDEKHPPRSSRTIKATSPTVGRNGLENKEKPSPTAKPATLKAEKNDGTTNRATVPVREKPKPIRLKLNTEPSYYERIFENSADRKIASLIDIEPGATIVGPSETLFSSEGFKKSFLESLKTPIIVTKDDSEDVAALKRAVNEAKIEMKARYDSGEDLAKIMIDTRNELMTLNRYRKDLEAELSKVSSNTELSEDEVKDFVSAANKMLEDKGIKPLTMPRAAVLRFQRTRESAAKSE